MSTMLVRACLRRFFVLLLALTTVASAPAAEPDAGFWRGFDPPAQRSRALEAASGRPVHLLPGPRGPVRVRTAYSSPQKLTHPRDDGQVVVRVDVTRHYSTDWPDGRAAVVVQGDEIWAGRRLRGRRWLRRADVRVVSARTST